jgi:hypothetical protein
VVSTAIGVVAGVQNFLGGRTWDVGVLWGSLVGGAVFWVLAGLSVFVERHPVTRRARASMALGDFLINGEAFYRGVSDYLETDAELDIGDEWVRALMDDLKDTLVACGYAADATRIFKSKAIRHRQIGDREGPFSEEKSFRLHSLRKCLDRIEEARDRIAAG